MDRHQRHAVTDADLHAYVDGQLDPARRVEVEAYLGAHPDEAAEVMEGLRLRDELRLFLDDEEAWPPPHPHTALMAGLLATALRLRALAPRLRGGLVAACLVGLGWAGHTAFGGSAAVDPEVAASPARSWPTTRPRPGTSPGSSRTRPTRPARARRQPRPRMPPCRARG
jgi:anti-sigma factor RsiW